MPSSVDFPHPDGPVIAQNSPVFIERDIPLNALNAVLSEPYVFMIDSQCNNMVFSTIQRLKYRTLMTLISMIIADNYKH